jgi:hypothetical protein
VDAGVADVADQVVPDLAAVAAVRADAVALAARPERRAGIRVGALRRHPDDVPLDDDVHGRGEMDVGRSVVARVAEAPDRHIADRRAVGGGGEIEAVNEPAPVDDLELR